MVLSTRLTVLLGISHPVICGGMQHVGFAEMAAAVSNAGGLGTLTALSQPNPEALRDEIRRCRQLTSRPFGVNLTILPSLIPGDYSGFAKVIADEKVALVEVTAASPKPYMKMWKEAGVKVLHKSATIRHALKAAEAGVDIIEIVGYEASIAGGQPGDEVGLWVLLPKLVSLLPNMPIVASGGSGTGRQLAAALSMGACGVTMATRFLCTVEAPVHLSLKQRLSSASTDERSTVIVMSTLNNATRVFKNSISEQLNATTNSPDFNGEFGQIADLASGKRTKKMLQETGDWDDAMWSCGQAVGLVNDIPTCKELLTRMVEEAEQQLQLAHKTIIIKSKL